MRDVVQEKQGIEEGEVCGRNGCPGAGAALLAEVKRLREVERLAKAYRAAVTKRRAHKMIDPNTDDSPLGTKWSRRLEELTTAKRAAWEAMFAALGKEAAE